MAVLTDRPRGNVQQVSDEEGSLDQRGGHDGADEEREVGGLGVHLVRNVMDEVSYHRRTDRNVVILIKHLEPLASTWG